MQISEKMQENITSLDDEELAKELSFSLSFYAGTLDELTNNDKAWLIGLIEESIKREEV